MRERRWVWVIVAVGLLATAAPAAARAGEPSRSVRRVVDGRVGDWVGTSALLPGRTALSRGELVYQDHVHDDHGGLSYDVTARQHTAIEPSDGDYRYPTDEARYAGNAADLFQLRVAAEPGRVVLLAWLNALRAPDTTVVSVGFDLDGARGQPALPWPRASGVRAVGTDVVVTAWGTGTELVDLRTGRRTRLDEVGVDTDANAIEVAVPAGLLPGDHWRIRAVTGLWDPAARSFMQVPAGAPTSTRPGNGGFGAVGQVFNVAFRDRERGTYYEQRQAHAIRSGDISAMSWRVSVDRLRAGASDPSPKLRRGELQAVLVDEGVTIGPGEGSSHVGVAGRQGGFGPLQETTAFEFYGRWQPYSLYVPRSYDGSAPIPSALVLHGRGGSHGSYNRQPGFLRDMGERPGLPGLALITPLARGESFYTDYGELSTLLAIDDAARRLRLDPDRQYLTGYSMGGYGVFRLAVRYPDRWAAAVSWAGFTGEFLGTAEISEAVDYERLTGDPGALRREVFDPLMAAALDRRPGPIEYTSVSGDPVQALEALVNLPVLQLGGTNDEIVPVTGQLAAAARLDQLGYRHRFDLYPGYEHVTFALVDDWKVARDYLGDRRRATSPRRVVLATSPAWIDPRVADAVRLPASGAWWVAGVELRSGVDDVRSFGRVDATSSGLPGRRHQPTDVLSVAPEPTPNLRFGTEWVDAGAERPANRLDLTVTNVADLAIDLAAAGLAPLCLTVVVTSDGPVTIRFPRSRVASAVVAAAGRHTFTTRCGPRGG